MWQWQHPGIGTIAWERVMPNLWKSYGLKVIRRDMLPYKLDQMLFFLLVRTVSTQNCLAKWDLRGHHIIGFSSWYYECNIWFPYLLYCTELLPYQLAKCHVGHQLQLHIIRENLVKFYIKKSTPRNLSPSIWCPTINLPCFWKFGYFGKYQRNRSSCDSYFYNIFFNDEMYEV